MGARTSDRNDVEISCGLQYVSHYNSLEVNSTSPCAKEIALTLLTLLVRQLVE